MSRIAGIVSRQPEGRPARQLDGMLASLKSRGEWQTIVEASDSVTVGWCGWRAPGAFRRNGLIVVLDGCIYNREDLGSARSDSELVANLYLAHGFEGAMGLLNGDFAISLYDPATRALWLARDRFGLKPLYYASVAGSFAFASRPGPLLTLPGLNGAVRREFVALFAASHYRYFDNRPEKSPFEDVAQLPAAHLLKVADGHVVLTRYWEMSELPDLDESEDVLAEQYRDLLFDSVRRRMCRADRPAFTLSGGMDSSSVLASAVRTTGERQFAFSTVYEDPTYDESDEIRSMLEGNVRQLRTVGVGDPELPDLVQRMIDLHDEPVATATWLSHYLLCSEVRDQGFGSLFGGLGGDELNAGEYEHFFYFFADLRYKGLEAELGNEIGQWVAHHDHPIFKKSKKVADDALARMVDVGRQGRCLPERGRMTRYSAALNPDYFDISAFRPIMDHPFRSYLKNRTYQDIFRETAPCCLRAEDRQATAFGLDNFLPFFDHRLVEFMFRIPGTMKIRKGVTKYLLREAMRGVLPEETRTRIKKTGWNAPAHVWFSGSGREWLLDLVGSRSFRERGIYRVEEVRRLIRDHELIVSENQGRDNHMMFFWQLVNLEVWHRSLDRQTAEISSTTR